MSNLSDIYLHCNEIEVLINSMQQKLTSRPVSKEDFVQFLKDAEKISTIMLNELDITIKTMF